MEPSARDEGALCRLRQLEHVYLEGPSKHDHAMSFETLIGETFLLYKIKLKHQVEITLMERCILFVREIYINLKTFHEKSDTQITSNLFTSKIF